MKLSINSSCVAKVFAIDLHFCSLTIKSRAIISNLIMILIIFISWFSHWVFKPFGSKTVQTECHWVLSLMND